MPRRPTGPGHTCLNGHDDAWKPRKDRAGAFECTSCKREASLRWAARNPEKVRARQHRTDKQRKAARQAARRAAQIAEREARRPGERKDYVPPGRAIVGPGLCRCGCGGTPTGKTARYMPGHHLRRAAIQRAQHEARLDDITVRAACMCGWADEQSRTGREARDAFARHRAEAHAAA